MASYNFNQRDLEGFFTGSAPAEQLFGKQQLMQIRANAEDPDRHVRRYASSLLVAAKSGASVEDVFKDYESFSKALGYSGDGDTDFGDFRTEFTTQLNTEAQMSEVENTFNRFRSGLIGLKQQASAIRGLANREIIAPIGEKYFDGLRDLANRPSVSEEERELLNQRIGVSERAFSDKLSKQDKDIAASISKANVEMAAIPMSKGYRAAMNAQGKDFFREFVRNPIEVISGVLAETAPTLPIPVGLTVIGGATGGPVGAGIGAGAGGFIQEYPASFVDGLSREGIDLSSATSVEKGFRDAALLNRANSFALKRASIIGAGSAVAGAFAGKFKLPKDIAIQTSADVGFEGVAQLATEGKINPKDLFLEGIAGFPLQVAESTAGQLTSYRASSAFIANTTTRDGQTFTSKDWQKTRDSVPLDNVLMGVENPAEKQVIGAAYHGNKEAMEAVQQIGREQAKVFDLLDPHFRAAAAKAKEVSASIFNALPEDLRKIAKTQFQKAFHQNEAVRRVNEDMKDSMRQMQSVKESILSQMRNDAITPDDLLAMDRLLHGFDEDFKNLPDETRSLLNPVYEDIRKLSLENTSDMHNLGATVDERVLNQERDYWPRAFDRGDGTRTQSVSGNFFNDKFTPLKIDKDFANRTKLQTSSRFRVIDSDGELISAHDSLELAERAAENSDVATTILHPATLEELQSLKLVEDVAKNLDTFLGSVKGTKKVGYIDKLHDLIKDDSSLYLSGDDFIKANQPNGYKPVSSLKLQIPSTFISGNDSLKSFMKGFVSDDMAQDLKATYGKKGLFAKSFNLIERNLRAQVTYRNPFRYFKQIPENSLSFFFADSKLWLKHPERLRASKDFLTWAFNLKDPIKRQQLEASESGAFIKEFESSGLMSTDFLTAEGLAEAEIALGEINDPDNIEVGNSVIERYTPNMVKEPIKKLKAIDQILKDAYHIEDLTYKFQYYNSLRRSGVDSETATQRVRDYMFDFEDSPRVVKSISRVVPFKFSVLWQFSRILANKLRDAPSRTSAKIAIAALAMTAVRELADEMLGVDDKLREKNERGFAALYPTDIVLPMTDSEGRQLKFSSRWLIPYSDITSFFPSSFKELRQFYRGSLPMTAQPLVTLFTQTDRWGNDLVFSNTKNPDKMAEQTLNVWMEVLKETAPGMPMSYLIDQYENEQKDLPEDAIINSLIKKTVGVRSFTE